MPGVGLQTRLRLLTDTPTARPSLMRCACTAGTYAAAVATCSLMIPTATAREALEPALPTNQQAAASEWSMQATEHFEIFYQRSQEPRLADVREAAEQAYAQVSGQLKYEVTQRVPLVLVDRDRDVPTDVVGPEALVAASGAPSRQVIVLSLESIDMRPRVIVHELTHQFAFEIIPQTSRAAPWIAEGLARHQRGVWEDAERQNARDAVAAGRLPTLDRLLDAEPYWSHALFDFIATEYGAEGIRRYLFALRTRANESISVAFGVTLGEFDNAFRRYLTTRFGQP